LFDTIVRPISRHLDGVTRLVFIPDATYEAVSFAALWERASNRFLVEQFKISAVPNVTALTSSAADVATQAAPPLIMGRDAAITASIAAAYASSQVVSGEQANRSTFLTQIPDSAIVHLAVPTRSNAHYPLLSRLILADDPGQPRSGEILGSEIAARAMTARLVVLDEIALAPAYQSAGSFALARAFLAAGVPAVLGTLPGADEDATRALIVGFHREMAGKASAAETLSRVQRNALQQNGGRLGAWTALVLYGSDR
jgi:CHAT domain-containing protein